MTILRYCYQIYCNASFMVAFSVLPVTATGCPGRLYARSGLYRFGAENTGYRRERYRIKEGIHRVKYIVMGNKVVTFTEQQLEDYQDCTFFTRKEILRVFKRFRDVNPELVPKRMTENQAHTIAVPVEEIEKLPELKENPFKRRICQVFSHDGSGNLTFEDFLDMMSVFSEAAPRDIKAWYAFRIYDLDDDMYIGREDLLEATRLLTKGELHPQERDEIVASVLDEADVDGDGRLSFMDFEHVVVRAPDFLSTFHIRV